MFSLKNKVAVIMGGSSELCNITAHRFSRAGAKVVMGGGDLSEKAKETGGVFVSTDVSKEDEVRSLLAKAASELGPIDVLVNVAPLEGRDSLDDEIKFRLKSIVMSMKHAARHMADNGSIINMASCGGLCAGSFHGSHGVSNEALIGITKSAALEFAERGVRVNCVCAGTMEPPAAESKESAGDLETCSMLSPLGRLLRIDEVAALFHFLASDESAFMTGVAVRMDGGISAGPSQAVVECLKAEGSGRADNNAEKGAPDILRDNNFSLEGKVAVVTGAASGLGKATALRFSRAGAKVVFADIKDAKDLAKEAGGIYVRTDVSKEDEVENLMQRALSEFGRLDIVVNNAGIEGKDQEVKDIEEDEFDKVLRTNLKSAVWGIKHAVPRMSDGGSIMSTSSYAGLFGTPMYGSYVMSKAGIIGLTRKAALELAPRGIRVNCICPGTMDTPMMYITDKAADVELKISKNLHPLGRLGKPEEAAALYHYLASDESAYITGQAIPLDGGMSAGPGYGIVGPLYAMTMLRLMPIINLLVKWFK